MKRFLALAALVLGLASCQTEPEGLNVNVGGEVDTVVTVSLPETTRANSAEGAFKNLEDSDEYTIRYIFQVFYNGTESGAARQVIYSDGNTVSFPVRLVPGRDYNFIAWADVVPQAGKTLDVLGEYNKESDYRYNTENLKAVTFKGDWLAMDETFDAYTDAQTIEYYGTTGITLNLTRPFAKLRVMTTDMVELGNLQIVPEGVTVEYTVPVYKSFDVTAQAAKTDGASTHTFTYNLSEVQEYAVTNTTSTLFTNYLFGAENGIVKFTMNVYDTTPELIKFNNFNTDIPVQRNYLTTIQGNVLTDGNNITVTVENDGAFYEPENVVEYVEVNNADEIQEAINEAEDGKETVIVLGSDIDLSDGIITLAATRAEAPQYALLIPAGKDVTLDLNGKRLTQSKAQSGKYAMIENNGTLTICNTSETNGTISYGDTATLTADVGYASNTIQNNGTLIINEGVVIKNTSGEAVAKYGYPHVIDTNGTLTINGGTLTNEANYSTMRIWTSNTDAEKCNVTINGGTFNGCIDFQAHNNNYATMPHYGTLTVNGGTFNADTFTKSAIRVLRFAVNANDMHATINGGTFNGKVWVRNIGTFESTPKIFDIYNGTFTTMYEGFDTLLAKGYAFVEGENDTYTVENVGHYTDAEGNEHITTAAGLLWFAGEVNKYSNYERPFENVTIYLENDIDLDGIEWTPIGDYRFSANRFCGTFDGQNHTISNFKITKKTDKNDSNKSSYGFFGNLEGTVKNVKVSKVNVSSYAYTAALVGRFNNGLIENCHVVDCAVSNTYWQGGILIGQTNAEGEVVAIVRNCSVSNSSITSKSAIGAISGPVTATKGGNVVFENCSVANCAVNQDGSFGSSYDKYFGSMFGYTDADADSSIEIKNFTVSNTTVKGESNAPISGDFDGNITIDGCKMVTVDTEEGLVNAVKAQSIITLANDITMSKSVAITNANFTLDGDGHTITMAEDATNTYALFDITGGKASINNVVFDGIKEGAVVRTVGVEFNAENVTAQNGQHTQQQGLFRLLGKSTVKDCTFKNNTCNMVVTLNFDADSNDYPQVIENCVFESNTCNDTAVAYYVCGTGATINGNKFLNNTVSSSGNAATLYMGFTENHTITNNLFSGNNVTTTHSTSKRATGGLMIGYEATISGNAFVGNTITAEGRQLGNDVCASVYYTDIDLSGNYWGGGAPVEGDDYYKEYNNYEVIINDYLTANPFN